VGNVEPVVLQDLENLHLTQYVDKVGYMPHADAIAFQQTSPVLLLLINNTPNANGILTGKFYEYMASERPILVIGPLKSDVATLLEETQAGMISDFNDLNGTKHVINKLFTEYKAESLKSKSKNYQQFSRKNQCSIMAGLLDEIIK
ncbi:MAG TPA: glycosyl transferase family 1, partial [Paludibacter sp.]